MYNDMYNDFFVMLAVAGIVILLSLFISYHRHISQKVPGLAYCLVFILVVCATEMLVLASYYAQDNKILLLLTALIAASMAFGNTAFALTIVSLTSKIPEKIGRLLRWLFLIPALIFIIAVTNPVHHLLIDSVTKSPDGFGYIFTYGVLSIPMAVYSYALVAAVMAYAFIRIFSTSRRNRKFIVILMATSMTPSLFNLLELSSGYFASVHITYLLMFVPVIIITNVFYQYLHTAREKAIAHTNEIYVLFDRFGSCVDANHAGRDFFRTYRDTVRPTISDLAMLVGQENLRMLKEAEFELETDGAYQYYHISSFQVSDTISRDCGDGFLLREVTEFKEQINELSSLATEDTLTGVKNRRYFEEYSKTSISKAAARGQMLTLLMMDIDFFKKVNDTYGHIVGDEVLVLLCRICTRLMRKTDVFCRYGGEEFVILLGNTDAQGGLETAERILKAVNSSPFPTSAGEIPVTVSIGGCTLAAERDDDVSRFVECADQMLYRAKNSGRNRVCYHK